MRRIHGIPSTFRVEHLAEELQVETIGQGVDYPLLSLLASALKAHVDRNLATKLGV
jgi:hypothetical protein